MSQLLRFGISFITRPPSAIFETSPLNANQPRETADNHAVTTEAIADPKPSTAATAVPISTADSIADAVPAVSAATDAAAATLDPASTTKPKYLPR